MKSILLAKLKATAWGLLLAASISVGAIALTYRPAAAQSAPKADASLAAKASPDDLEALRLEVEALRLDLKATKEHVKALEDGARKGGAEELKARELEKIKAMEEAQRKVYAGKADPTNPLGEIDAPRDGGITGTVAPGAPAAGATGEVEAAMQTLRKHPDDKQALEVLDRAIQRLKDEADQFKAKVHQKCDEAWKVEQFKQAIQSIKDPQAPAVEK